MSAPDLLTAAVVSASSTVTKALATATVTATATSTPTDDSSSDAQSGECELLGPFAIIVQAALGGLALLSLVYKRWRERPQRPIKIWAFDVSKQVVGSILLHLANLLMSMISSGDLTAGPTAGSKANPCSFYLLNLAIDTTLGIPILILWLKVLTIGALKTPLGQPPESIKSGNYGEPPSVTWWLKQCCIYFFGLVAMKLCVYGIFAICPWIVYAGDWALKWTEGNEVLQILFVMLLFPLIMNALQYYIIDGFIKNKESGQGHHVLPTEDEDNGDGASTSLRNAWDASFDSEEEEQILKKPARTKAEEKASNSKLGRSEELDEYDPDQDGESSNGSSRRLGDKSEEQQRLRPE